MAKIKIEEILLVRQDWYETETTKTGWDSHGWTFEDTGNSITHGWDVYKILSTDKFGNPTLGIAQKETALEI